LQTQNDALLLKNLDKFFNRKDLPWVNLVWEKYYSNGRLPGGTKKDSFWWRDILKLLTKFKGIAYVSVQDGSSVLFWEDQWNNLVSRLEFPELHSFAKNKAITLQKVYHQNEISNLFHLPLSVEAYAQLHQIVHMIQILNLVEDNDSWSYIWGSSLFSSSKAYKALVGKTEAHQAFNWLWKSFCQPKHKVFFVGCYSKTG